MIKMLKKGKYVRFKNYERKTKSQFMIYANFESILVPQDNGKKNPDKSYTEKYQKHVACSYGYKLVCVEDKFSKSFKSYFGKDPVYNFFNSMVEECTYCNDVMKNHFSKGLVMAKKDNEDFEHWDKCWICDNVYADEDVDVQNHCHITGKYRGFGDRDCNIKVKLNHKFTTTFDKLKRL